ncbi:MAG: AbrB/MazE/SpoVT family DNA-binding domain-containing protein [Candidatus Thermoplasmatota archaeon]|nr:AbrB/MazE/SpoVT family DNA-binding domain-containing protein [Candidatus Thermoplasmatota archaeon]
MVAFIRRVYEKGKVTIPKELRELHNIENGDLVKLQIIGVVEADERTTRRSTDAFQKSHLKAGYAKVAKGGNIDE